VFDDERRPGRNDVAKQLSLFDSNAGASNAETKVHRN
jgi:hypothetical protein